MSEVIQLHKEISHARMDQLFRWMAQQGSTKLRLLAKIKKVQSYYLGETMTYQNTVKLGGHEINTHIIVNLTNGNVPFSTYDCVDKKSECDAILKNLTPGSVWLVEGDLEIIPKHTPRLLGAKFLPIPQHLLAVARIILTRPIDNGK